MLDFCRNNLYNVGELIGEGDVMRKNEHIAQSNGYKIIAVDDEEGIVDSL